MSKHTAAPRAARAVAVAMVGLLAAGSAPPVGADHGRQGVPGQTDAEVVVYGATPSGVTAAIAAARAGADVTLIEPTQDIGGMMTSGLSWTDRGDAGVIGGIALEVFDRIESLEGSTYGRFAFAPSTAAQAFAEMLAQAQVEVVLGERLAEDAAAVVKDGSRIVMIRTESGDTFAADAFIDASYEGDLMARAGVAYRVGRESTAEFDETLAGVRGWRFVMTVPPGIDPGFPLEAPGPLGSGDDGIQSSNYRVCLSTDPADQVPFTAPDGYDPSRYDIVAEYLAQRMAAGLSPSKSWVLHVDRLVDSKWDLNQNGPLTFGMPGHNRGYPDGSYAERAQIEAEQRAYQQGFLYFLQNDVRVPEAIRTDMLAYGLCADEFVDTGNWPPRMYLRVGRRMEGRTMVTQHDVQALVSKPDTIGLASYPLDSHAVSRWMTRDRRLYIEGGLTPPKIQRWSIPYGAITPAEDQATNLLVSVAASATHVAYASLRVEPQYMIMGQAAGVAAALARELGVPVQAVPVDVLQARLEAAGAVLDDPGDLADSGFYTEVAWAYYEGITGGCAPRLFCPGDPLGRDEMASLLARTLDLPVSSTDFFVDDDWSAHEGDINRVAQAGITLGCAPDRYCPTGNVTRQEMASFLKRALDLPRTTTDYFTDDETSVHEGDINSLAASGITSGCSATRFCPTGSVTRGQVMAFLYRAFDGGSIQSLAALQRSAAADAPETDAPEADQSADPTPSPSLTPSPVPSATPSRSPSATPDPTPSPSSSGEPSEPPSPSPSPSLSPSPSPTPTPSDGSGASGAPP